MEKHVFLFRKTPTAGYYEAVYIYIYIYIYIYMTDIYGGSGPNSRVHLHTMCMQDEHARQRPSAVVHNAITHAQVMMEGRDP